MAEFRMPSLGADMDSGTVVDWLVAPGDEVHRGQVVAVVDTAKSAIEVEVFEDGRVDELLVPVGRTVAVGTPLARLSPLLVRGTESAEPEPGPTAGEGAPRPTTSGRRRRAAARKPRPAAPRERAVAAHDRAATPLVRHLAHERGVDLATVTGTGPAGTVTRHDLDAAPGRPRVSPYARRRAAELGVDLAGLQGTGAGGAIVAADVEHAAAAAAAAAAASTPAAHAAAVASMAEQAAAAAAASEQPAAAPSAEQPAAAQSAADRSAAMRAAIAALMARSKREIPHYYLQTTIDLDAAMRYLHERNESLPPDRRLLPAALLLKAAAVAVRAVPELNGVVVDGSFRRSDHIHLGVAVSLRGGGLVAPAIHDADTLPLDALMAALKDLVARARAGRLRGSEMSDPTITVTNLGDNGAELVHGVIYAPQVALVGFGRVVPRPWAVDGMLAVRPVVTATLAADHRVSDGHRGSRYLAALDAALQHPEDL